MSDADIAKACMPHINGQHLDNYGDWLRAGMAIHDAFGGSGSGLSLWSGWSQRSAKYREGDCERKWKSFRGGRGRKCTVGTLVQWARDAGFEPFGQSGASRYHESGPSEQSPASTTPLPEPLLQPRSFRELHRLYPELRCPVLDGLLRQGETMNIIAASKMGKSWLVIDLALAVTTGRNWLGRYQAERGKVLIIDNELHGETSAHRVPKVAKARGILLNEFGDHLFIQNLRGKLRDIFSLRSFFNTIAPGEFRIIILDAFYRFMPKDSDENDNATMAEIYNELDRYADRLQCSFVLIHHSSKGVQAGKAVTDVGAGAGSQSRATDTHLVLRPHEQDGVIVLDAAVRSWVPIKPVCLRWEFPIWTPDETLDPTLLKRENSRKKSVKKEIEQQQKPVEPEWSVQQFVAACVRETADIKTVILARAMEAGMSERKASMKLDLAEVDGLVYRWTYDKKTVPHRFATVPQPVLATSAPDQAPPKPAEKKVKKRAKKRRSLARTRAPLVPPVRV